MKLLIKVFIDDINSYDLIHILDVLKSQIVDKKNTSIYITSNDISFDFENYDFSYLTKINITSMINYKLNELEWDIVLPILRPCIVKYGFDSLIKKLYKENFPDLDGVLWLNTGEKDDIIKFPVVGKKYYNRFGYLYNPAYNKKYFEEEFAFVAKYYKKVFFIENILIKNLPVIFDDDKIYELRKKFNFGLV